MISDSDYGLLQREPRFGAATRLSIRLNALRYRLTVVDALGQRIMNDARLHELPY